MVPIGSALDELFPGPRTRKSGGANTVKSSLSGRCLPRQKCLWRLPERERGFIGNKKTVWRSDDGSARRRSPATRSHSVTILRFSSCCHGGSNGARIIRASICEAALRRNFRAFDDPRADSARQTPALREDELPASGAGDRRHFRVHRRRENGCGPAHACETRISAWRIGEFIAGAKGMDATRSEKCARAQGGGKKMRNRDSARKMKRFYRGLSGGSKHTFPRSSANEPDSWRKATE